MSDTNTTLTVQEESDLDVRELQNDPTALATIIKAEADQMAVMAHQYPRNITNFIKKARMMLNSNREMAIECFYVLPRAGKKIEGPSVRLAEIVASAYGNLRVGGRVIDEGEQFVTGQGVCHDLENNLYASFEVKRRIVDSHGKRYNVDMVGTAGNAAASIGFRNALFRVVPKVLWLPLYLEAREIAKGDIKTLDVRRDAAIAAFAKLNVSKEQVFEFLGVPGAADIDQDKLVELIGIHNSIRDGESPVEQFFLPKEQLKSAQRKQPAEQASAPAAKATPATEPEKKEEKPAEKAQEKKTEPANDVASKEDIAAFHKDVMMRLGKSMADLKTYVKENYQLDWPLTNVKKEMLSTIFSDLEAQAKKK